MGARKNWPCAPAFLLSFFILVCDSLERGPGGGGHDGGEVEGKGEDRRSLCWRRKLLSRVGNTREVEKGREEKIKRKGHTS